MCFMCSYGVLSIVGEKESIRHYKNMVDGKFSILVLRVFTMGSVNYPVVLLENGESMHYILIGNCLSDNYGLP